MPLALSKQLRDQLVAARDALGNFRAGIAPVIAWMNSHAGEVASSPIIAAYLAQEGYSLADLQAVKALLDGLAALGVTHADALELLMEVPD